MMTKTKKSNTWKYALSLPLFMFCFILMSAMPNSDKRVRKGNITTFRGNTFEWKAATQDTVFMVNPQTGENQQLVTRADATIIKCNGQAVTMGLNLPNVNSFTNAMLSEISGNISKAILQQQSELPHTIESVEIKNLVLDKNFKVLYYDVQTREKNTSDTGIGKPIFNMLVNAYPKVNNLVDKILTNDRLVNPKGLQSDRPFYLSQANADILPFSLHVKLLND